MRQLLRYVLFALSARAVLSNTQYGDDEDGAPNTTKVIGPSETVQDLSVSSPASIVTSVPSNRTCLSRTVNYITHTLPQQCLRTDRAAVDHKRSASADESGHAFVNASTDDAVSSTTSNPSATESKTAPDQDAETDSPLDNANFLSFEEWKRQNQPKVEQGSPIFQRDRQRPGINNALDTLGDEGEIELDFSGFGSGQNDPRQQQAAYRAANGATPEQNGPTSNAPRSKDAGKTCKERTNYASFDCAANVLKTNPECKSASSVLVENKDTYMLNTCSANNKFFIIELCNPILVDTVVLANYEFFSSIFRQFRVSASESYPVKLDEWVDLGTFEARNTREVQAFLIEHPRIWARYLRIEFISHYGSEYYCPVSLLRVHGTTMLEDVWLQQKGGQGENAEDEVALEPEATALPTISQEPASSTDESEKPTLQAMPPIEDTVQDEPSDERDQNAPNTTSPNNEAEFASPLVWTVNITGIVTSVAIPVPTEMTCASNLTSSDASASSKTHSRVGASGEAQETQDGNVASQGTETVRSGNTDMEKATKASASNTKALGIRTPGNGISDILTNSEAPRITSTSQSASSSTHPSPNKAEASSKNSESPSAVSSSPTNTARPPPSTGSTASQPQPSTQESFFKSIHKRLQQLEANSTLSLQYIEEQSRILRDAFSKVEKRQISATTTFLTTLNQTVMTELHGFRQAYDQLWQSTVIELDGQREQYQREMLALSSRLTLVADELVWQKRMGIVQSTLLLLCLGLVLFARTGQARYLEVPLMQQMMNRSHAALSRRSQGWESPPESPSPESRSPVRLLRNRFLWRSHTEPSIGTDSRPESKDGPLDETVDVDVKVDPPTPESGSSAVPTPGTEHDTEDVEDVVDTREVQSSPPTPTGTRETEPPDLMGVGVGLS